MEVSQDVPQNSGKGRQFFATFTVSLICISYGTCIGWPSPVIPQLRSSNPPIGNSPMTEDQTSWIGDLLPVGGMLLIPFCGILAERLGRKRFALSAALPFILSWLLVIFARDHVYLYAARLFMGMANAMTLFIASVYIGEIASEDIRGVLGSLLVFALDVGILFAYVAGAFLSYRSFAVLSLLCPVLFIAAAVFIPETPVWLVRRDRQARARKSLMFYRGNNEALVEHELTKLRSQATTTDDSSDKIRLGDLFKDRATRKGLIISFGLLASQQLSGFLAMMSYAETIFKLTGSSLSSDVASIIIAIIQLLGSSMSTMLIERAGRRLLALVSCFGMAASHAVVGLFFHLQLKSYDVSSISWLPVVALSSYIVTFCLGMGPVPIVVVSEIFRLDVSSHASTLCFVFFFAVGFVALRTFDLAMKFLGADGCFFVLAVVCAVSFVFCYCLLPETKGRRREDIVDELAGIDRSCRELDEDVEKSAESDILMSSESVQL